MKAIKATPLFKRLGIKKTELRKAEPVLGAHGLGHRLSDSSRMTQAPCIVCARPLGAGRLGNVNLNVNRKGGCWALYHIGHPRVEIWPVARHEAECASCRDARADYEIRSCFARVEQGIWDAVEAESDCRRAVAATLIGLGYYPVIAEPETEPSTYLGPDDQPE